MRRLASLCVILLLSAGCEARVGPSAASSERPASQPVPPGPTTAAATPAAATGAPTPSTQPIAADGIHLDGFVRVVVPELNVREGPSLKAPVLTVYAGDAEPPPLRYGTASGIDRLFVIGGPVVSDGHTWWQVVPIITTVGMNPLGGQVLGPNGTFDIDADVAGWVAAGDASAEWLVPLVAPCPSRPVALEDVTIPNISWAAKMVCFRGERLAFRGWLTHGGGAPGNAIFAVPMTWSDPGNANRLNFHVLPGVALPGPDQWIEITGQFDHPQSLAMCPWGTLDHEFNCRSEFIVVGVRALGPAPG